MRFRLLAILFAGALWAQTTLTVEQLVSFLRSSVQLKQPDRQVAKFLAGVKLSQSLDDRTIEEMQSLGIGPKTVEALNRLRDESASLPKAPPVAPPPKPRPIPPPSAEEQAKILDEVRQYAIDYTKSLPNYICTKVIRRYFDPSGLEMWNLGDTLTVRLSYFEQQEDNKLILINNHLTNQAYGSLGGATSAGEFASMLKEVFAPETEARFDWDHWATLRGRRAMAFSYDVAQSRSHWTIDFQHERTITPAYRGLVYVDRDTHMVLELTLQAMDIPSDFPVQQATTKLDYDFTKISGQEFLLPLKAEVRMRSGKYLSKNDVEFRLYRKFTTDTTIKFDDATPPPLPESQTKEQK